MVLSFNLSRVFLYFNNWDSQSHLELGFFLCKLKLGFISLHKHNNVFLWRWIILPMNKISLVIVPMVYWLLEVFFCLMLTLSMLVVDFEAIYPFFQFFNFCVFLPIKKPLQPSFQLKFKPPSSNHLANTNSSHCCHVNNLVLINLAPKGDS